MGQGVDRRPGDRLIARQCFRDPGPLVVFTVPASALFDLTLAGEEDSGRVDRALSELLQSAGDGRLVAVSKSAVAFQCLAQRADP